MKKTKAEIKELIANKAELIEMKKKAVIKYTDGFTTTSQISLATKSLQTSNVDDLQNGEIKRTIIANTYNWLDSHSDVHAPGLFSKSISERSHKVLHLHDHKYEVGAKVGKPLDISEKQVEWTDLGVDKAGTTEALFMESTIKRDMNKSVFNQYLDGDIDQHSVGMQYVALDLAVNDAEEKDEFALWERHIDTIGNRAKAEDQGFFWVVTEAKLIEVSAVIAGSNELTPTVPNAQKTLEDNQELKKDIKTLVQNAPDHQYKSLLKSVLHKTLDESMADTITIEDEPSEEEKKREFYLGKNNLKN